MRLTISGLPPASSPDCFTALFGRYPYGYKPWDHCQRCFVARNENAISPTMQDGSLQLRDELFYLCAVGRDLSPNIHPHGARRSSNVHLAVRPRKGSVAATGSIYGTTFLIEDAEAIPILPPTRTFPALLALDPAHRDSHARCKMFHFAYQLFDVDDLTLTPGEPVHQLRPPYIAVPGIRQDASGRMLDPNAR
jgi:hypothetical protein